VTNLKRNTVYLHLFGINRMIDTRILERLSKRAQSPLSVCMITALTYGVFLLVRLGVHHFDLGAFVVAGDHFCNAAEMPAPISVAKDSDGYDGQFYYRLALNPFTRERLDYGILLDSPSHRQQRILYPLIVWILALGNAHWIPTLMVMVNYAGLCALAYLAALYARGMGISPAWGLVVPFFPGFVLTLSRDLVEITAMTAVMTGILLARHNRRCAAAALFTLAVFARETTLLIPLSYFAASLIGGFRQGQPDPTSPHRIKLAASAPYLAPLAAYIVWQLHLASVWGNTPLAANKSSLSIPLAGLCQSLLSAIPPTQDFHQGLLLFHILCITLFALMVIRSLTREDILSPHGIAWLGYLLLVASFSANFLWSNDWNYIRGLSEFCIIGSLLLIKSPYRLWCLVWTPTFLYYLFLRTDIIHAMLSRIR